MKINTIHIQASRHFDGSNTYFACSVLVNGEYLAYIPYQYGYERQFEAWACERIRHEYQLYDELEGGYLNRYCQDNNIELTTDVIDVTKKEDMLFDMRTFHAERMVHSGDMNAMVSQHWRISYCFTKHDHMSIDGVLGNYVDKNPNPTPEGLLRYNIFRPSRSLEILNVEVL